MFGEQQLNSEYLKELENKIRTLNEINYKHELLCQRRWDEYQKFRDNTIKEMETKITRLFEEVRDIRELRYANHQDIGCLQAKVEDLIWGIKALNAEKEGYKESSPKFSSLIPDSLIDTLKSCIHGRPIKFGDCRECYVDNKINKCDHDWNYKGSALMISHRICKKCGYTENINT